MKEEIHKGCGGIVYSGFYATYPPIPFKQCSRCGAKQEGERPKIKRIQVDLEKK